MSLRHYAIVSADGRIVRAGYTFGFDPESQCVFSDGERFFEQEASEKTHYFDGTSIVAYTDEQRVRKSLMPPHGCEWSDAIFDWMSTETIGQVKEKKRAEVKAARDAAEFSGFEWEGSTFDSNERSQIKLTLLSVGAIKALSTGDEMSEVWTLADNTTRTLNASDAIGVAQAMGAHLGLVHTKGRELRAAIEAATTIEETEAIVWTS